MAKDLNLVQAKSEKLGEYSLILNNDQLKELGKLGATAIEEEGKKTQPTTTSSGRIIISPDSQENNEGGFIGNQIDWSQFLPNEANAQVPELLEKAKKWEDNFQLAITTLASFVGAGLGTYMSGGSMAGLANVSVSSVFGPFVDLYAADHPEEAENLQKLLDNLDEVRKRVQEAKEQNEEEPELPVNEEEPELLVVEPELPIE